MNQFKGAVTAKIVINAPSAKVWDALTNPKIVKQYLFGAEINSDWHKGSPITYKGVWQGKPYEDKGIILGIEPGKMLKVTHYSPLSGLVDVPENYHVVTYVLSQADDKTTLTITQENNKDQVEVDESEKTWTMMLGGLKTLLEQY
jgi:uncharacterized protein YndB with AHSA1/START domain